MDNKKGKLQLNKETIAMLNDEQQGFINGGNPVVDHDRSIAGPICGTNSTPANCDIPTFFDTCFTLKICIKTRCDDY